MARIVPDEELQARRPKPQAEDPLKNASQAIERLALIVTHVAQLPPPQINIPPAPQPQARPRSIEATVHRDDAGKMQRVVLTPIY
jgi:hypothetical protein